MECTKLGSLISRQIWQVNKEKTEFPPSFPICPPPCPICWSPKPSLSPQVTMGSFGLLSHSQERSCHEKWLHKAFWCASHQRLLCSPSEIKIPVRVCMKLKKKRKCWNKLPGEVGDSLFKNRSRQTSVRKHRRLFDLVLELGERVNGAVKSFSALREDSYTHIFISAQVRV